jgi:hypothetical protein
MLRYTTAPEEQVVGGAGGEWKGWITIQVGLWMIESFCVTVRFWGPDSKHCFIVCVRY